MSATFTRSLIRFVIPGGLLAAAAVAAYHYPLFAPWIAPVADILPPIALGAALLLGWRFDRSRLVFTAVVMALAAWALLYADRTGLPPRPITEWTAVLLPLNIGLLALAKERGIFSWHGLLRWSFIAAQPLAVWWMLHFQKDEWLSLASHPVPFLAWLPDLTLGQPALLLFAAALLVTGLKGLRERNAMESALFWTLALTLYALLVAPSREGLLFLFGAALLVLVVTVVEISYAMAFRDELTGLPGRRALNQELLKLGGRYSIAMLDVDHFKKFNDRHGHDVGDEVLRMVAARMAKVKGGGKPFRYGGEEFTVLFPGKSLDRVVPHLEQLREAIAGEGFTIRSPKRPAQKPGKSERAGKGDRQRVTITVSVGVAEREGESRTPQQVIKAADKALYRAKKGGRNRVAA